MTLLKIGTPVNPYMANEEEEGPKEDPLGPLMQNLRKMQAEEESAKVEGKPKKRAKNKISSAPEPSTTSRYSHLLKDFSDEEEKDETPEEEVNLSALHECFLQKKRRLLGESSHSLRSLKIKSLKSIQRSSLCSKTLKRRRLPKGFSVGTALSKSKRTT